MTYVNIISKFGNNQIKIIQNIWKLQWMHSVFPAVNMHSPSFQLCNVDQLLSRSLQLCHTRNMEHSSLMLKCNWRKTHRETAPWQYSEDYVYKKQIWLRDIKKKVCSGIWSKQFSARPICHQVSQPQNTTDAPSHKCSPTPAPVSHTHSPWMLITSNTRSQLSAAVSMHWTLCHSMA